MQSDFDCENKLDANGNSAGGFAYGVGMKIDWQNGPLGRGSERILPNGAIIYLPHLRRRVDNAL